MTIDTEDTGIELYEMVESHIASLTRLIVERFKGVPPSPLIHPFLTRVLLDNALMATAQTTAVDMASMRPWRPHEEEIHFAVRIEDLLADERLWLINHKDAWRGYGSAVVRVQSRDMGAWEHLSSRAIDQVVAATVQALQARGRLPRSLFDPVCGSGTLLASAAGVLREETLVIAGQDINEDVLAITQRVLAIGGRASILDNADVMGTDPFPNMKFDLVVMDPPSGAFGYQGTRRNAINGAGQVSFLDNRPSIRNLEWHAIALALEKVTPPDCGGGTLIAFLSRGALVRQGPEIDALRQSINAQDLVKAVVALPERVGPTGGTYALVLSTVMSRGFNRKAQVIDLRGSFDATRNSWRHRHITPVGVAELGRALTNARPSRLVRTVELERFERARFRYIVPGVSTMLDGRATEYAFFERDLPREATGWEWPLDLVPADREINFRRQPEFFIDWSIDRFMGGHQTSLGVESLPAPNAWPSAPLLTLALHVEFRRGAEPETRDSGPYWTESANVLALPLEETCELAFGEFGAVVPKCPSILIEISDEIDGEFLATWLKTEAGSAAINDALQHALGRDGIGHRFPSKATICFLAHLIVPVPSTEVRMELIHAQGLIDSERRKLQDFESELWQNPGDCKTITSQLRARGNDNDLAAWAETLPYPMASSLRTVQALQHDSAKKAAQLVHFWEASAAFLATYLLSALHASEELWQREIPQLREALTNSRSSFDQTTLGTWRVTIERLTKLFRDELASDEADIRQRAEGLLGSPPKRVKDHILDPKLIRCLTQLNHARNNLGGHAATMNLSQADEVLLFFDALTEEFKAVVGFGWSDFPLVRPIPRSTGFRDGRFTVTVDKLVGPTSPFLVEDFALEEALEDGGLYLLGGGGAVKLMPFIKIGRAPNDAESTALFYNRRTPDGVRMVAYQFANDNEMTEPNWEIESILDDIATRQSTIDFGLEIPIE